MEPKTVTLGEEASALRDKKGCVRSPLIWIRRRLTFLLPGLLHFLVAFFRFCGEHAAAGASEVHPASDVVAARLLALRVGGSRAAQAEEGRPKGKVAEGSAWLPCVQESFARIRAVDAP